MVRRPGEDEWCLGPGLKYVRSCLPLSVTPAGPGDEVLYLTRLKKGASVSVGFVLESSDKLRLTGSFSGAGKSRGGRGGGLAEGETVVGRGSRGL